MRDRAVAVQVPKGVIVLVFTLLLALSPASGGDSFPMSEAIGNGWSAVIYGQAIDTVCESYSVDEAGSLSANFVTQFTIWEVVQEGDLDDIPVEGETIELVWRDYVPGPEVGSPESCGYIPWSISDEEVDIIALWRLEDGFAYVDTWYEGDAGYATGGGVGQLPSCGEDLQQQVIDELYAEDADESGSSEEDKSPAGCSVAGSLTAGPLALGLALVGMVRRRGE